MFTGKVAMVTGGANGVGRALIKALAEQGAACVILDLNEPRMAELAGELEVRGSRVLAQRCDATSEEDWRRVVAATVESFGRVDILVNCAGGSGYTPYYQTEEGKAQKWAEEIPLAEWESTIALNLTAPFLGAKHVLPYMKRQGWGRIVNFASAGAWTAHADGTKAYAAYAAAKAGVPGLTRQLAREVASHGITVNCVCPGATLSERVAAVFSGEWKEQGDQMTRAIPMGRMGRMEEQAAAVLFLASEAASYVTGAILDVNGGRYMR